MQENLKKEIGTFGLAAAVVNMTIGTGIFVLPALAAEQVGAAAILCYLICGLLIFLIALCFAQVGSGVSESGGTYTYIGNAFGPFAGFLANHIFWFGSCVLSDAAVANAMNDLLVHFFPVLNSPLFRVLFFIALFGGLAWINVQGAKYGLFFIISATFIKLIPLLLIIAMGVGQISTANLHWHNNPSLADLGSASLILFYAFLGVETAVSNGGEFKNPARTVPRGILFGLLLVLIIYSLIQLVTQGLLGDQLANYKDAPLAEVSGRIFGEAGLILVSAGTAISMLGNLSGEMLAIPRTLFAGSRNGILPGFLSAVHPSFATPYKAIIAYAVLDLVFALSGGFRQLAIFASAATLLIYLGVVLAALKQKWGKEAKPAGGFSIPGGLIIPSLAAIIIVWMLSHLSKQELSASGIFIAVLIIIYAVMNFFKRKTSNF